MKENRLWMMVLMATLAAACSAALAFVNVKTAPIISRNESVRHKSVVLGLFELEYDPLNPADIEEAYAERIEEREANGLAVYFEKRSGRTAVSIAGSGFQGAIRVILALDGDIVTAFRVVSQAETPGLGSRISEDGFQRSFIGKRVGGGIKMVKTGTAGESEFDGVTGATETSRALERLLNAGLARYFEAATR